MTLLASKEACEKSLSEFVKQAWPLVEPGAPYVHGWHIDVISDHLEAVTRTILDPDGASDDIEMNRLLINVPPGMMKSLLTSVFWPAWLWTKAPHLRILGASHSQALAIRDSTKMRRLVVSDWYTARWPHVKLTGDVNAKTKFETTASGFREAVAAGSITGSRGDVVIIDDPHSVEGALSEAMRESTATWFREAVPTRLNNPARSAIVVIMQRLHEQDVSGIILDEGLGYTHLMLPMRFDPSRRCETPLFLDEREDGELLFPERFPEAVVARDEKIMGSWAVAGQFQQTPTPRGGGILRRDDWQLYDEEAAAQYGAAFPMYPPFIYTLATLDTAYTEKQENDPSALTIWGVFEDADGNRKVMLADAWSKRLRINGDEVERLEGETNDEYRRRASPHWGLVQWVAHSCKRYRVDLLLIESKAAGISTAQELQRMHRFDGFGVRLVNPGSIDKVARAHAVQPIFTQGQVFAPDRKWADDVITQCESFPKGAHDDYVDCTSMALKYLREQGLLQRNVEVREDFVRAAMAPIKTSPVYEA